MISICPQRRSLVKYSTTYRMSILAILLSWLVGVTVVVRPVSGQLDGVRGGQTRTLMDALRAVDSVSTKELEWVRTFLEIEIAQGRENGMAHCVLGIVQFREQEYQKSLDSMERASAMDPALRTTSGKFKLLCAINNDDAEVATKLFQSLVSAAQRASTPLAVRKSYSEWLGEIVGTLDVPEARSPVDPALLESAYKSLLGMPETALSRAFSDQYRIAKAKAERTQGALQKYTELGDAATQELVQSMTADLAKMEDELAQATEKIRDASDANQAELKELRLQLAGVRASIQSTEAEWESVTPGMPAPVEQPFPPRIDLVYVDLFQYRWVTEIRNGNRYTYQIQERRPYWEVEAQRNAIYQWQLNLYNSQLSLFTQYQKNLAEWRKRDQDRRQQLLDQRKVLDAQASQLRTQIETLNGAKIDHAGNNDLKKSIADLKLAIKAFQGVLKGADAGKPQLALRTTNIDPWLITEEKKFLIQRIQKQL